MKKVLIFVLGCNQDPYPMLMQASMDTWDSVAVPGVETRFYCGSRQRLNDPRVLYFKVGDSYEDMGRKDLVAYDWALKNLEWDFMARVNASCYVRKHVLIDRVQELPTSNLFQGIATTGLKPFLWGGAQFIMSRDVIQAFVDNGKLWDHGPMEDVAMSDLATKLGIPMDHNGRACSMNNAPNGWLCIVYGFGSNFYFTDLCEMKRAEGQYFIRVKQDLQRHKDVEIMKALHQCGI